MVTTEADLIREVRSALRGYNLVREQVTFLNGPMTSGALTFTVNDGTLIQPGVVEIEDECIWVQSVDGNIVSVAPDGRGWDGTTAASHADDKRVTVNPPYPTWRLRQAINDAILGTFPDLYATSWDRFTYNPSVTTYQLSSGVQHILRVTTDTIGPSGEQVELSRYTLGGGSTDTYETGQWITLGEPGEVGRDITVTYAIRPGEIPVGGNFTTTGLAESAVKCVVYGTLADLVSKVDLSRVNAGTAVAAGYDSTNRVGSATQLAAQITARYQMELAKEQDRLRKAYPVRVRWVR